MVRLLLCCCLLFAGACSKPEAPDKDRPVEPQAGAALTQAVQAPIGKAREVQQTVDDAKAERDAAVDAQTH